MFWLFVAWIVVSVLSYLLNKQGKSKAPPPGEFTPPEVAAGTPIPVVFGTARVEPIICSFSYTLRALYTNGQLVGYNRGLTYIGLLSWGPLQNWSDIIFDEDKKLTDQAGITYPEIDFSSYPPVVTNHTTSSYFNIGGFPDAATQQNSYGEIFLPFLFGGAPPGEGGIKNIAYSIGDPPPEDVCTGLLHPGGFYEFFLGRTGGNTYGGTAQPPIDDIKVYGHAPKDGSCNDVLTTSGTGRIRYPRFGYVYLQGVDQGTSPTLKKQEHVITSSVGSLNDSNDANPISVLRAILTDTEWGLGISQSLIDATTFRNVELALGSGNGAENFGISGILNEQKPAEDYIGEILRTIDAVLYRAPDTGLLSIQAIRAGAASATLDETNVVELEWTRRDMADTINEVSVAYLDRSRGFKRNIVTAQDHANIAATGNVRSQTFEFPFISTEAWALKVAARELKAATLPLGKGTARTTRDMWDAVPGDILSLSWARYGLDSKLVRVLSMSAGDLDDGVIELELIEDVYGLPDLPYDYTTDPWTDPAAHPTAVPTAQVLQNDDGVNGEVTLIIEPVGVTVTVTFYLQPYGRANPASIASYDSSPASISAPLYTSPQVALSTAGVSRIYWAATFADVTLDGVVTFNASPSAGTGGVTNSGQQIVINDGSGGFIDVFDSTAQEVVA